MTRASTLLLATLLLGCGPRAHAKPREEPRGETARDAEVSSLPASAPSAPAPVVIDAADPNAPCVFGYRGPALDLGARSLAFQFGLKLVKPPLEWLEREGSTWAEVRGKSLAVDFFVVPPPDVTAEGPAGATPFVEARVCGGAGRTLSFYLNGHAIGAVTLVRGVTRVVALKGSTAQPVPGANELILRVSGLAKGSPDPSVELDWIHFGVGDPDPLYAVPTQRDAVVSRSFGGQPGRALSLRGPGFARCEGWLPSGSVIETRARIEGAGAADAEVRVIRDRAPPTVIGTLHLDGSDTASERVHSWPLGDLGIQGTLGAVELSVVRASPGARVVFGEPRVLGGEAGAEPAATLHTPRVAARGVVLIVMSELGAHSLAAYGGTLATPELTSLASAGAVFDNSRATTAVANGAVGSMLTGLPAPELGVIDGDSRLPRGATTIADAVTQASIASAFFTANPLTSATFGFDRGWAHFEAHGPLEEGSAERVYDAAATWIGEHHDGRFLVVIHARGGHPPWDISLERVKGLPPDNYTGGLDARHAGELLGKSRRTPGSYRFDDADRARAWALYGAAMEAEDAGVGRVLSALKAAGVAGSTTVLVTSDVGINDAARVPFAESELLDEAALATPLFVRWAHEPARGAHVVAASSSEDIATTVLAAFGLPAPIAFHGKDLRTLAEDGAPFVRHARLAADQERFALRWGAFVTTGMRDHETKLCDLSLEPACVTDVRESYPLASRLLHEALYGMRVSGKPPLPREPASLDLATQAALKAWGR